MLISVCKIFRFDAAHWLPNYEGKCVNLHGHSWTLEVELEGPVDSWTGMVTDFASLKDTVVNLVISKIDHTCLNDFIHNPTCENLLDWILIELDPIFNQSTSPRMKRLRLWETPDSYAEIS